MLRDKYPLYSFTPSYKKITGNCNENQKNRFFDAPTRYKMLSDKMSALENRRNMSDKKIVEGLQE